MNWELQQSIKLLLIELQSVGKSFPTTKGDFFMT